MEIRIKNTVSLRQCLKDVAEKTCPETCLDFELRGKSLFISLFFADRLPSPVQPSTTNFAKRKILDLAIYYSEKKEEVSIYIYVMLEQAEKKFSIYEIKFLRTKNVEDIKNGTAERRSMLLLDPPG